MSNSTFPVATGTSFKRPLPEPMQASRHIRYSTHNDRGIRYTALGIGASTIAGGSLLSLSETASKAVLFWSLPMPAFVASLGALIVISCLVQTVLIKYDTAGRKLPQEKIGTEFGLDDAEITTEDLTGPQAGRIAQLRVQSERR